MEIERKKEYALLREPSHGKEGGRNDQRALLYNTFSEGGEREEGKEKGEGEGKGAVGLGPQKGKRGTGFTILILQFI